MRKRFVFVGLLLLIMMVAQRSPAPIVEEEKPTPAPERSSRAKRKSAESSESTRPETRAREPRGFAGTWSGKVSNAALGDILITLTFAAGTAQVTEHSILGTYSHPITSDGRSATWRNGLLNEIVWTFTPNNDGQTAHVTSNSPVGNNADTTFRRGGAPAVVRPASEFPTAKPVPEKPGFVYNPFDPTSHVLIDVRGKPSGTKLVDPKSGKAFLVP